MQEETFTNYYGEVHRVRSRILYRYIPPSSAQSFHSENVIEGFRDVFVWSFHDENDPLDEMFFISLCDMGSTIWFRSSWGSVFGYLAGMHLISTSEYALDWQKDLADKILNDPMVFFDPPKYPLLQEGFEVLPEPGYVYVMASDDDIYYKIGFSISPPQRLAQIQPAMPFDVRLLFAIKTCDMRKLERDLHQRFRAVRCKGEWFKLTQADINEIKARYQTIKVPAGNLAAWGE